MTALETLLPREANNDYHGGRAPLYVFALLSLVMLGRSMIHLFKGDSGSCSSGTAISSH